MTTQQTDALQCAADLEYSIARHGMQDAFTLNAYRAMKMVLTQHARIADLEAQLEAIGAGGVSGPLVGRAAPPTAQAEGWTRLPGALPEPGTPVLLDIGKKYPIRALWAEKHTVRVGTDVDDWGEYDEETDEYYCPEGWYEWNEHEEVHWAVSETPRAWSELPQPLPAAPGPADGESK